MGVSEKNKQIVDAIKASDLTEYRHLRDLLDIAIAIADPDGDNDLEYSLKISKYIKELIPQLPATQEFNDLYWRAMLFEARNKVIDSALVYLEKNRDPEDRFYQPRREQFIKIGLVQALQDLIDDKLEILSISMPPGVGKTTLGEMFLSLFMGKRLILGRLTYS